MAIKKTFEKKDYRQELTDKVCKQIEVMIDSIDNAKGWNKPWFTCSALPLNPETGTKYKGINVISLWSAGFEDNRFYTYLNIGDMEKRRQSAQNDLTNLRDDLQAGKFTATEYQERFSKIEEVFKELESKGMADRKQPMHIQKGAIGTPIFKAVEITVPVGKSNQESDGVEYTDEQGTKKVRVMAYSGTVFNASQIANITLAPVPKYDFEPHAEADIHVLAIMEKTGLRIEHNEAGRAYYSPGQHKVVMPNKDKFVPGAYYDTLLHEIGHSTGPKLGRDMSGSKGDAKYAREELIAELSSSLMSSELGIPHNPSIHENHAAYLKSWLGALQKDKSEIFKAAAASQKSVSYQNDIRHEYKLEHGLINQVKQEINLEPVTAKPTATISDKQKRHPVMAM